MKKRMIPVLIALILILIISGIGLLSLYIEKYSYSKEQYDLNTYFEVSQNDAVALLMKNELIATKGKYYQNQVYLPYDYAIENINSRLYYDDVEGLLIYTTPTQIIESQVGASEESVDGVAQALDYQISILSDGILYISTNYLKKYSNFSIEYFEQPSRACIQTQWGTTTIATIQRETAVRYQGGVKSKVLRSLAKDEDVKILEKLENWSKIMTKDGFIGYVENKRLKDERQVEETPVLEVANQDYTSMKKDTKINLVWNLITNASANGNVSAMLDKTKSVNVVSPTWYRLSDNQGGMESLVSTDYINAMHQRGVEVWALVDNFTYDIDTTAVLTSTKTRRVIIQTLVDSVKQNGIDGINVDFELVPNEAGPAYVQFMRELSVYCRKEGIILSVDIFPPSEYTAHYNLKELGIVTDYVIIMGYNEHYKGGGKIGPVASINFVEKGIADTVAVVPSEKVINALPFYAVIWKTSDVINAEAVSMAGAKQFVADQGLTPTWDEVNCYQYVMVNKDNVNYELWIEDEQSIGTKLNVMSNYQLAGVAAWRLGQETPQVWDVIEQYMNQ